MKIYRIPLAEYIALLSNIAFSKKYIAFGEAEYIPHYACALPFFLLFHGISEGADLLSKSKI